MLPFARSESEDFSSDDQEHMHAIDWTPEKGFRPRDIQRFYPRPGVGKCICSNFRTTKYIHHNQSSDVCVCYVLTKGSGSHLGLTVILNSNTDDYHCSSTNSAGFKILFHSPIELPKIADYGISVTPGYETRVIVTPNLYDTSNNLRRVPREVRQCVFENEYDLSYFRYVAG